MGYFIGYRIAEAFYKKSPDKRLAIQKMIQLQDYKQFLVDSSYF